MPISVICPYCSARLSAPDERAGRRAKCAGCGQKLLVPGPPPAAGSDAFAFTSNDALPIANGTAGGTYRPDRAANPGLRWAVGTVVAGLCVLAVVGGYVLWTRFGPSTKATIPTTPTAEAKP